LARHCWLARSTPPPAFPFSKITMSKSAIRGTFPRTRPREAEARRVRAETFPGPGGRRGFYARALGLSTTFSRKTRISRRLEKHPRNQRDFCASEVFALCARTFGGRNELTYRFASQASSQMRDLDGSPKWRPSA
jgi:hypothetical protein